MLLDDWKFMIILVASMTLSAVSRKLTVTAALTGGFIACLVFLGTGYTGISMIAAFFVLGSAATSWKREIKEQLNAAEKNRGRRNARQVLANGGVAALTGLFGFLYPLERDIALLMTAAAFASATADTLSSELGSLYGKKSYNILTLKTDTRGLDGVISVEGTLIGLVGSTLIALIYTISYGGAKEFLWIIVAGTTGNFADSLLGALFERRDQMSNNCVNFLNTLVAAFVAWLSVFF